MKKNIVKLNYVRFTLHIISRICNNTIRRHFMQRLNLVRRRIILRTAERGDALDYMCQAFPSNCKKEERERQCRKLEKQIESIEDGITVLTILRREDNRFIGFLFTKRVGKNGIQIVDLVIPMSFNMQAYAIDCIKQFVKSAKEEKLCEKIFFKSNYTSAAKKYIEEFLEGYPSRCICV